MRSISKIAIIACIVLISAALVVPSGLLAKEPPGADLVSMSYSRGVGLAVLSRYELFLTKDGKSWKQMGFFQNQEAFSAVAVSDKLVLVATEKGTILRSVSGGPFEKIQPPRDPYGRKVSPLLTIAIGPKGEEVVASSGQGLVISKDGGQNWSAVADPFWKNPDARQVISVGYAGKDLVIITRSGAYRKSKTGYEPFDQGLPSGIKPTATAVSEGNILLALPEKGVYLATRAKSWKAIKEVPGDPIAFIGFAAKGYLAARPTSPLNLSDSKGSNWKPVGSHSPSYIPKVSVSTPFGDFIIFRGKGLVRLEGEIFKRVDLPLSLSSLFAYISLDGGWVAGTQGGVYISRDQGVSWEDVTPLSLGSPVNVILKVSGSTALLGSEGSGVFMTTDGGNSWTAWNKGLGTANTVRGLVPFGGGYLAATENGLMWTASGEEPSWAGRGNGMGRVSAGTLFQRDDIYWLGSHKGVFSARDGEDFRPVNGYAGRVESLDVAGKGVLALVDGKILLGEAGTVSKVKQLAPLPAGVRATCVSFVSGQPVVGTTRGAFSWTGASWSQVSFGELPLVRIVHEGVGAVRGITAGAGTGRYP